MIMTVKNKGGKVHVDIEANVTNPGYVHDKFVTLLFEVMNTDEVVAKTTIDIKVKQNWRTREEANGEHGQLVLAPESLKKAPMTKMRITMMTKDY